MTPVVMDTGERVREAAKKNSPQQAEEVRLDLHV